MSTQRLIVVLRSMRRRGVAWVSVVEDGQGRRVVVTVSGELTARQALDEVGLRVHELWAAGRLGPPQ